MLAATDGAASIALPTDSVTLSSVDGIGAGLAAAGAIIGSTCLAADGIKLSDGGGVSGVGVRLAGIGLRLCRRDRQWVDLQDFVLGVRLLVGFQGIRVLYPSVCRVRPSALSVNFQGVRLLCPSIGLRSLSTVVQGAGWIWSRLRLSIVFGRLRCVRYRVVQQSPSGDILRPRGLELRSAVFGLDRQCKPVQEGSLQGSRQQLKVLRMLMQDSG
jgi:hypothetical protein